MDYLIFLWERFPVMSFYCYFLFVVRVGTFSCSYKGIVKGRLKINDCYSHDLGSKEGKGIPGYHTSIGWITLFTALKFIIILNFPDFFFTTNIEEIKRLVDSFICWASIYSCTSYSSACIFLLLWATALAIQVCQQWPLL